MDKTDHYFFIFFPNVLSISISDFGIKSMTPLRVSGAGVPSLGKNLTIVI